MHVLFRPDPPVSPSGMEWVKNSINLPFGPFQPTHGSLPDEDDSFECDPVLWKLWVEFHQTMRPLLRFPRLGSMSTRDLAEHALDADGLCISYRDFGRRLTDQLHLVGAVVVPPDISADDQWVFVYNLIRDEWMTAFDGPMSQRKIWIYMVYELTIFYINLEERKRDIACLMPLWDFMSKVKNQAQSFVSYLWAPSASSSASTQPDRSESNPEVISSEYQSRPPISVVQRRIIRSRLTAEDDT
ncbi:hypothetical protein DFH06DRAFT_1470367 [Mycena polygramma]|nr:hypothetical protein DFH06DRAFT_1470367 [Mycena polygramma]